MKQATETKYSPVVCFALAMQKTN